MIHELKTQISIFERVGRGELKAIVAKYDVDYQSGDVLRLIRVNDYGSPTYHFVERRGGRFYNQNEQDAPIDVTITHVLPASLPGGPGTDGYVLLSVHRA